MRGVLQILGVGTVCATWMVLMLTAAMLFFRWALGVR